MKVINIDINRKNRIELGRRGEGNVRQIVFDCTYFAETYGSGTAQLLHRRRGDEAPYPVLVEQDVNTVTWTVSESDTANVGIGEAELIWRMEDRNAKSAVYETETLRSLSEPGDPPEPWQSWVDAVLKAAEAGGATPKQIAELVKAYLEENPVEESDPTVPEWAKQPQKPSYKAEEVGADASGTAEDLIKQHNESSTSHPLIGQAFAKLVEQVGSKEESGTAESKVSEHNTATDSHNDIRLLIEGLTTRLNTIANSDDIDLDQLSEIVAYIKSNRSLIDAITTSKINVSDIIDNLTTNVSNKPLSAAQGVALKALIDAIPTVELDETLTDNTKAAPAGMVGELKSDLEQLKQNGTGTGTGLSTEAIDKLEEVGNYLVYTTADGGSKWTELISILRNGSSGGEEPDTPTPDEPTTPTLIGITVVWSADSADVGVDPKTLITSVEANMSDGTSQNVISYSVTPIALAEGANTVTVSYQGKTATKNITGIVHTDIDEPIDTTVVITDENYGWNSSHQKVEFTGMGISKFYDVPSNSNITYYIASTLSSVSGVNKAVVYNDDTFVEYYTTTYNTLKANTNGIKTTTGNKVSFPVPMSSVADSYAYVHQTGEILFAGENTQYYGKRNVSEVA